MYDIVQELSTQTILAKNYIVPVAEAGVLIVEATTKHLSTVFAETPAKF